MKIFVCFLVVFIYVENFRCLAAQDRNELDAAGLMYSGFFHGPKIAAGAILYFEGSNDNIFQKQSQLIFPEFINQLNSIGFDIYSNSTDKRKLNSLKDYSNIIDKSALEIHNRNYNKIIIVGHSRGGGAVLEFSAFGVNRYIVNRVLVLNPGGVYNATTSPHLISRFSASHFIIDRIRNIINTPVSIFISNRDFSFDWENMEILKSFVSKTKSPVSIEFLGGNNDHESVYTKEFSEQYISCIYNFINTGNMLNCSNDYDGLDARGVNLNELAIGAILETESAGVIRSHPIELIEKIWLYAPEKKRSLEQFVMQRHNKSIDIVATILYDNEIARVTFTRTSSDLPVLPMSDRSMSVRLYRDKSHLHENKILAYNASLGGITLFVTSEKENLEKNFYIKIDMKDTNNAEINRLHAFGIIQSLNNRFPVFIFQLLRIKTNKDP